MPQSRQSNCGTTLKESLVTNAVSKNELWLQAKKLNHLTNRITENANLQADRIKSFDKETKKEIQMTAIKNLDTGKIDVAGSIMVLTNEPYRHITRPKSNASKEERIAIC